MDGGGLVVRAERQRRLLMLVSVIGLTACANHPAGPAESPPKTNIGTLSVTVSASGRAEPVVPGYAHHELGIGVAGASGWLLTGRGLSITTDAGSTWTSVRLPAGVRPAAIGAVAVGTAAGTWLAVPAGAGVGVYHRRAAAQPWQRIRLVPDNPHGMTFGGPPGAGITLGPGSIVTAVVGWRLSTAGAYDRIFVSSDGGRRFDQHPVPDGPPITALTFLDRTHALAVAGPTGVPRFVSRTSDGGATWVPVTLPVPPGETRGNLLVGPPSVDGIVVRVPVLFHGSDDVHLHLYRSTDHGRSYTPGPALVLPTGEDPGEAFPAVDGARAWFPTGRHLYRTTDGGSSWTSIPSVTMPYPLGLAAATTAIGVQSVGGCRRYKSDCYSYTYLIRTSDGGRSWAVAGPP